LDPFPRRMAMRKFPGGKMGVVPNPNAVGSGPFGKGIVEEESFGKGHNIRTRYRTLKIGTNIRTRYQTLKIGTWYGFGGNIGAGNLGNRNIGTRYRSGTWYRDNYRFGIGYRFGFGLYRLRLRRRGLRGRRGVLFSAPAKGEIAGGAG